MRPPVCVKGESGSSRALGSLDLSPPSPLGPDGTECVSLGGLTAPHFSHVRTENAVLTLLDSLVTAYIVLII